MSTPSTPLRCGCRRQAETNLRCSRCDAPICPDCSVVGVVGMLCRKCASAGKTPLYNVDAGHLALAYAACLAVAAFLGYLLRSLGGLGFFALFGAYICGIGIGETALRVTGRKRGPKMEAMVVICTIAGMMGPTFLRGVLTSPVGILLPLLDPIHLVGVGFACFGAVMRVRNI